MFRKFLSDENQPGTTQNTLVSLTALVVLFVFTSVFILTLSRLSLVLINFNRYLDSNYGTAIFWVGLRFDMVLLAYVLLPIMLFVPLASVVKKLQKSVYTMTLIWLMVWFAVVVLLEVVTPAFAEKYDARPNYLLAEYLKYPREIAAMLWGGYRLTIVVSLFIFILLLIGFYLLVSKVAHRKTTPKMHAAVLYCIIGVVVCGLFARSSFDPRPINPSIASLSHDSLINDLALNSTYSLAYSLYQNYRVRNGMYSYGPSRRGYRGE